MNDMRNSKYGLPDGLLYFLYYHIIKKSRPNFKQRVIALTIGVTCKQHLGYRVRWLLRSQFDSA